jgi:hypothetical protein
MFPSIVNPKLIAKTMQANWQDVDINRAVVDGGMVVVQCA